MLEHWLAIHFPLLGSGVCAIELFLCDGEVRILDAFDASETEPYQSSALFWRSDNCAIASRATVSGNGVMAAPLMDTQCWPWSR